MNTTATRTTTQGVLALDTPIGRVLLEGDDEALFHLTLPNQVPGGHWSAPERVPEAVAEAARQLKEYFAGARRSFDLALVPRRGTPFQRQVWFTLAEIPYGETISYAELAAWVGRPTAFRAVGQANGANPLAIVLPCHRVIATGGGLGGYGGGLATKTQLLALEGATVRAEG